MSGSLPLQAAGAGLAAGISEAHRRQLAAWLAVCSGWVASMVVLGGVTRLTRSGLSMTDWKFTGERPPHTQVRACDTLALASSQTHDAPAYPALHPPTSKCDFQSA